ncbi:MAG: hypothetical protein MN733_13295, partial [Nitrososphaera sp.]|nr:hypothetical protein [Nitrososphaera sp.]
AAEEYDRQVVDSKLSALGLLAICKSDTTRWQFTRKLDLTSQVYSVGTFVDAEKPCYGYLQMINGSTISKGESVAYQLRGIGTCGNITKYEKNTFDPNHNPNGPAPGDYLRTVLHYDGALPKYWSIRGQQFEFVTK